MDYKIKDISLKDFGHREIEIAEQEMPGLMQLAANTVLNSRSKVSRSPAVCT